ncbi:MAG: hypothetical protein ACYC96_08495 [Fimbriimonadaceae bacterium]
MPTLGRMLASLALLFVIPVGWVGQVQAAPVLVTGQDDSALQSVTFRGISRPDGKPLGDDTQIECKVYDPKKPESTAAIAHEIGSPGSPEFEVALLNNTYTHETLNGCRCSIEIHGKGEADWDVTPYLEFKFIDGSKASVGFGNLKLGSSDGYKLKYDVLIDGL